MTLAVRETHHPSLITHHQVFNEGDIPPTSWLLYVS